MLEKRGLSPYVAHGSVRKVTRSSVTYLPHLCPFANAATGIPHEVDQSAAILRGRLFKVDVLRISTRRRLYLPV